LKFGSLSSASWAAHSPEAVSNGPRPASGREGSRSCLRQYASERLAPLSDSSGKGRSAPCPPGRQTVPNPASTEAWLWSVPCIVVSRNPVEYAGAIYHVMSRGDRGEDIPGAVRCGMWRHPSIARAGCARTGGVDARRSGAAAEERPGEARHSGMAAAREDHFR